MFTSCKEVNAMKSLNKDTMLWDALDKEILASDVSCCWLIGCCWD